MMRDMARATGRDVSHYEKMLLKAKEYIRERFLTTDGRFRTEILMPTLTENGMPESRICFSFRPHQKLLEI